MAKNYHVDGNKEMIAFGAMNMAGSCASCYLTAGPFSRSAVNRDAGCRTAASNAVMALAVLATLLFLTPLFRHTPQVALSAIIASAMLGVVDLRAAARLALWLYAAFLRPAKPLRRRYGAWAVVTGATDGIGRALAFRLAAAGLGVVLVGRNPDKLAAVAAELEAKRPGAGVRTFVVDFAADDLAARVGALGEFLRGLDVGVLVNNVGASYPYARYFHEVDEELMRSLIRVNVEGVTRVTHAVLPGMVERKRGAIVNIGSGSASVVPSDPMYSVYAATKA